MRVTCVCLFFFSFLILWEFSCFFVILKFGSEGACLCVCRLEKQLGDFCLNTWRLFIVTCTYIWTTDDFLVQSFRYWLYYIFLGSYLFHICCLRYRWVFLVCFEKSSRFSFEERSRNLTRVLLFRVLTNVD